MEITDHARSLCRLGLSARPLGDLQRLPVKVRRWSEHVEEFLKNDAIGRVFGADHEPTLDTTSWLASFVIEPRHEPSGFSLFAHAPLSEKRVLNIYRAARQESKKLTRDVRAHDKTINSSYLPDFYTTLEALRAFNAGGMGLFSSKRRQAKEIIKGALRSRAAALGSDETKATLAQLTATYETMEQFRQNPLYRQHLGSGFRGCQTNWTELKQHLLYSQAVRHTCRDTNEATQLLGDWHARRHDFKAVCDAAAAIQSEAAKLAKLCSVSENERTAVSLQELLSRSQNAEISIRKHIEFLTQELHDDTLTPAVILKLQSA